MGRFIVIRCPLCNRKINYIKITTGEGVCSMCGVIDRIEMDRQKKEQLAQRKE